MPVAWATSAVTPGRSPITWRMASRLAPRDVRTPRYVAARKAPVTKKVEPIAVAFALGSACPAHRATLSQLEWSRQVTSDSAKVSVSCRQHVAHATNAAGSRPARRASAKDAAAGARSTAPPRTIAPAERVNSGPESAPSKPSAPASGSKASCTPIAAAALAARRLDGGAGRRAPPGRASLLTHVVKSEAMTRMGR